MRRGVMRRGDKRRGDKRRGDKRRGYKEGCKWRGGKRRGGKRRMCGSGQAESGGWLGRPFKRGEAGWGKSKGAGSVAQRAQTVPRPARARGMAGALAVE